jgi:hypothetical protein
MADEMHPRHVQQNAGNNHIALEFEVTLWTKPAKRLRCVVMANKASAAVSSWGFSGYIAVLPKKEKPTAETTKKQETLPAKTPRQSKCS